MATHPRDEQHTTDKPSITLHPNLLSYRLASLTAKWMVDDSAPWPCEFEQVVARYSHASWLRLAELIWNLIYDLEELKPYANSVSAKWFWERTKAEQEALALAERMSRVLVTALEGNLRRLNPFEFRSEALLTFSLPTGLWALRCRHIIRRSQDLDVVNSGLEGEEKEAFIVKNLVPLDKQLLRRYCKHFQRKCLATLAALSGWRRQ